MSEKQRLKAAKQVTTLLQARGAACTSPFCGAAGPAGALRLAGGRGGALRRRGGRRAPPEHAAWMQRRRRIVRVRPDRLLVASAPRRRLRRASSIVTALGQALRAKVMSSTTSPSSPLPLKAAESL